MNCYLDLIHQFLSKIIDAIAFTQAFCNLWTKDRDALYAQRSNWTQRYDLELQEALRRKEISSDEFSERFYTLFGLDTEDKIAFAEMTDAIFSSCSAFEPDDAMRDEHMCTEGQLRACVSEELQKYEHKYNH